MPRLSRADRAYLAARFAALRRDWAPGDRCLGYRCDDRGRSPETVVARVVGEIVHLENGESVHWSRMRAAPAKESR